MARELFLVIINLILWTYDVVNAATCPAEVTHCVELHHSIWNCFVYAGDGQTVYQTRFMLVEDTSVILAPLYSTEHLQKGTNRSPGSPRPVCDFNSAGLSNLLTNPGNVRQQLESLKNLYSKEEQMNSLTQQCAETQNWFSGNNYYFARGHYAPSADFYTMDYRERTFHYLNIAPQWQIFNQGNWAHVESSIQRLVDYSQVTESFRIYTGGHDDLTCPSNTETLLIRNGINTGRRRQYQIFIPKVFFKVVSPYCLRGAERPILITMINHPTMTKSDVTQYLSQTFCARDICNSYPYDPRFLWFASSGFRCDKGDRVSYDNIVEKGYTYACEASDTILNELSIPLIPLCETDDQDQSKMGFVIAGTALSGWILAILTWLGAIFSGM